MLPFPFEFGPVNLGAGGFCPAVALIPGLGMQVDQSPKERCTRGIQVLEESNP